MVVAACNHWRLLTCTFSKSLSRLRRWGLWGEPSIGLDAVAVVLFQHSFDDKFNPSSETEGACVVTGNVYHCDFDSFLWSLNFDSEINELVWQYMRRGDEKPDHCDTHISGSFPCHVLFCTRYYLMWCDWHKQSLWRCGVMPGLWSGRGKSKVGRCDSAAMPHAVDVLSQVRSHNQ